MHDSTTDAFLREILRAANAVRARHRASPLRLNDDLIRYAKSRVREVSQGMGPDKVVRRKTSEVLYWGSTGLRLSEAADARGAVDRWYAEVTEYDFDHPGFSPRTGHFTQLVWQGSTHIGAARAIGGTPGKYETYIAVEFEKAGNIDGEFEQNVSPASHMTRGAPWSRLCPW
ncbi:CAP domain-containing protein [Streptomyces sp. S.PB5]|uniref:CAP domain-containing protein n=1 Tax=Streptomyces sp. S.PB5 TaxID=3020844 RepID=UPI0025AF5979|nr:CAP domain-containing protein [Streptomyces sp. S.PB5]MDN3026035.1 CAP domain-containing protein [Streptomyces sp. S.PB5]